MPDRLEIFSCFLAETFFENKHSELSYGLRISILVTETISVIVNDELKGSIAETMPIPLQCLLGLLAVALPKGDADVFS